MRRRRAAADPYTVLREAIVSGRLSPGEPLVEQRLAEELSVSRTPVREALRRLEQEGLVQTAWHKGARVATLSADDVRELFQFRAALEGWSARQAATRLAPFELERLEGLVEEMQAVKGRNDVRAFFALDSAFHELINVAAGNRRIIAALDTLVGQTHRIRLLSMSMHDRIGRSVGEHRRILAALRRRDPDLSEQEMRTHILNVEANVVPLLEEQFGIATSARRLVRSR